MADLTTLYWFLLASLFLAITPGPGLLCVVSYSISQGRKAGIVSSFGSGLGMLVHAVAVALGLSALLVAVPLAFEVVKIAGALYLLYLGLKTILSKEDPHAEAIREPHRLGTVLQQGLLSGVLNPKAALFFLAFLPQFVNQSAGNVAWQILLLGLIFSVICIVVSVLIALVASSLTNWVKRRPTFATLQRWATGGIFIGFGVQIALAERS
jgi:threonine/homoserine/homoserine lactone efflux protein